MYVCFAVRLKAPKRNGLAIWKNLQNIITQRLDQRDYFQFAILFKRRYMAILNFQLFDEAMSLTPWPSGHLSTSRMLIKYAILRHT